MDDLEVARAAAVAAAQIIRARGSGIAEYKGAVDPVTAVDREAEAAITKVLGSHRPADGLLAEEGTGTESTSGRRWVVDPLDGTVNFLHGVPQVSVSVALESDSEPVVGVIRDVYRDEEFTAERGKGAYLNGAPITVSGTRLLSTSLVSTGFGYDRQQRAADYTRVVTAVLEVAQGIRRLGSAALDLAWVACGRYDGHWEVRLSPWDVAAGMLIVREAGGTVTASDGGPASHRDIVATNGRIHEDLRKVVRRAMG
jgi:myo-inositol-1(or 4)-monophosphatase